MTKVELIVSLKIPDTTAITTFHTIERLPKANLEERQKPFDKMGYKVEKVIREIYYKFEIDGDEENFKKKIAKIDILVNANKNNFKNKIETEEGAVNILVKDADDKCQGLLHTLQQRLGLSEIKSIEKGVLWTLHGIDKEKAKEIGDKLLHNENYQEMSVL